MNGFNVDSWIAAEHCTRLGKDPDQTQFLALQQWNEGRRPVKGLDAALKLNAAGWNVYVIAGNGTPDSDRASVKDRNVVSCPALFVEWDDRPLDQQLNAWQQLALPEPSFMVATGGKSIHCWWCLDQPIQPERWKAITKRLIAYCGSDEACKNPARTMRLAGSIYHEKKTGNATGTATFITPTCGAEYRPEAIETCLPPERPPLPLPVAPGGDSKPLEDLLPRDIAALARNGASEGSRNADCFKVAASAVAIAAAATTDGIRYDGTPEQLVLTFAGKCTPVLEHREALQCLRSAERSNPQPDPGWRDRSSYHRREQTQQQQPRAPKSRTKPKQERRGPRQLSHTKAMACLERCVQIQAKRERNSLRRRARLLKAAKDLGLSSYVNRQELSQRVLEAKDEQQGHGFRLLSAADRSAMAKPVVHWLVPGLVPEQDLTIIGGRPKVGKTRLAVAIAAAVLNGTSMLDLPAATKAAPVILCTDDQSDGDTAEMLSAMDLWHHPALHWSRHFRLNERDLDALLGAIKANPGALVVIDSLRSIARCLQHGENDPEIGATLYDLKQAVTEASGTLLLVHHCNKANDLVGVEALSGHNAIAGAANGVLTLHYLPGANGQQNKQAPERRLVREARSGTGFDLVITREGPGGFRKVSDLTEWTQEQLEAQRMADLSEPQQQALEALQDAAGEWLTRRQVCEALGIEWTDRGKGPEAKKVERALKALQRKGTIQTQRDGVESTYKFIASRETLLEASSASSSSHTNGSQLTTPVSSRVVGVVTNPPPLENLEQLTTLTTPVSSPVSSRKPLRQQADDADDADDTPCLALAFNQPALVGSGADVVDDGDDPHWPKRREVA